MESVFPIASCPILANLLKTRCSFELKHPITLVMIVPLVLGYVVGAVGFYTLLNKTASAHQEEGIAFRSENPQGAEVFELFPATQEERKAA
jgi:ABC-type Fe3+ transport system permease subunit